MSVSGTNPNVLDLCRLCLVKDESLIPVFDSSQTNQLLCDKINLCLAVQISSEDRISQQICISCLFKIDSFYEFRVKSSESQQVLESWLQTSETTLQNDADLISKDINNGNDLVLFSNLSESNSCGDNESEGSDSSSSEDDSISEESESADRENEPLYAELHPVSSNVVVSADAPGPSGLQAANNDNILPLLESHTHNEGIRVATPKGFDTCEFCGISLTKFKLEVHRRKHTGERPFKCLEPGCSRAFTSKGNLTSHSKVHQIDRPYVCHFCRSSFKTSIHLTNHVKIHTGEKSYYCDLCDYSSIYKATLLIHRKRHLKEYSVICEVCGKGFYNATDLKEHMSRHTGDTPFSCEHCSLKFRNKYQLRKHKSIVHKSYENTPQTPVQCEQCLRVCPNKRSYKNHTRRVHGEMKFECDICGKIIRSKSHLVEHMRIHSGEKPYSCKLCGKSFAGRKTIKMHQVVHTGEKKYECDECGRRFTQKSSLNAHKKLHNPPLS